MTQPNPLSGFTALNALNAKAALAEGLAAIANGQSSFDLGHVQQADSSAVALLLAWSRAARAAGRTLSFYNLPANVRSLADVYGVEDFIVDAGAPRPQH
jgi:phospholipid transport system transporter-binding protein